MGDLNVTKMKGRIRNPNVDEPTIGWNPLEAIIP
jgi:hypothetical protein